MTATPHDTPQDIPSALQQRVGPSVWLFATLALGACGGDGASPGGNSLTVERDTVGDTVVVRTVSGSRWGPGARLEPEVEIGVLEGDEAYMFGSIAAVAVADDGTIYATDRQARELRVFNADGSHRGTWGRDGGGPGEFNNPDGGLAVLGDGRVVVRDPGNARMQVFDADGAPLEEWPVIPGGFSTSSPIWMSRGDTLLTQVLMNLGSPLEEWLMGLQRVGPQGEIIDTLEIPETDYEPPFLQASTEQSVSRNTVPYSAGEHWAWHPAGYFLYGIARDYAFTLLRPKGPIRVERAVQPVPVTPGEAREERARTTHNLRLTDPNWRWDGPDIPGTKPPYDELYTAEDGRIWVYRQGPGVEVEDPAYDPSDPDAVENRWRDAPLFDVFEADGTFVGTAEAPLEISRYPHPVFRGDRVWAVTRDDLGVQRIVRYRVETGAGATR